MESRLNLYSLCIVLRAIARLMDDCFDGPRLLKVSPSIFALRLYVKSFSLIVRVSVFCLAMLIVLNLSMFVCIFHLFS